MRRQSAKPSGRCNATLRSRKSDTPPLGQTRSVGVLSHRSPNPEKHLLTLVTCTSFFRGGARTPGPIAPNFPPASQPPSRFVKRCASTRRGCPPRSDMWKPPCRHPHPGADLASSTRTRSAINAVGSGFQMFHAISPSLDEDTESPLHNEVCVETTFFDLEQKSFKRQHITKPDHTTIRGSRWSRASHTANPNASPVDESSEGEDQVTSRGDPRVLPRKGLPGRESRPNMPVCSRTNQCTQTLEPRTSFLFCTAVFFCNSSARKKHCSKMQPKNSQSIAIFALQNILFQQCTNCNSSGKIALIMHNFEALQK